MRSAERPVPALATSIATSAVGALLVTVPGYFYRIDRVRCDQWPSLWSHVPAWLAYLAGVALIAAAWLRVSGAVTASARPVTVAVALCCGAVPNLVAATGPMYLSEDPLAYCAVGHAMASHDSDPHLTLRRSLPPDDPFLTAVQPGWRDRPSAYSRGFNQLSALVARIAGANLTMQLRLYQLLGVVTLLFAAWLCGIAGRHAIGEAFAARAVLMFLLSPLAIIEGSLSGHNDVLLAATVALALVFAVTGRRWLALLALALGLEIKDSAILLVAFWALAMTLSPLRHWLALQRNRRAALALGLLSGSVAVWLLRGVLGGSPTTARLLGPSTGDVELCVRSIECLPRAALFWLWHKPGLAHGVNLLFRLGAGAWLLHAAIASVGNDPLKWSAAFLFIYYLFLHPFVQGWYLLSLLPLLPYASPELLRPMCVFIVSLVTYYIVDIPMSCGAATSLARWGAVHVLEGAIVIVPATVSLLSALRRRRERSVAPSE